MPISIRRRELPANISFLDDSKDELSKLLARVFAARGITTQEELDYSLKHLLKPNLFGLREATELLFEALEANANILIVGDFDVDGATSCALAVRALKGMGFEHVDYLVPDRVEYGYGLSPELVGVAALKEPDIIITVDNGISSVAGVYAAQALGMMVIVTDHHLPGDELPTADVIVNPNLPNDNFSSKSLAGVGVVFYLMLALRAHLRSLNWFSQRGLPEPNLANYLDLVALGTVADVVALDRNNRILVRHGLQRIQQGQCVAGIKALLEVSKRSMDTCSTSDLGFALGPRLNAAGRLDDMSIGIECLLTDDPEKAQAYASQLDEINIQRREMQADMVEQASKVVGKIILEGDQQTGERVKVAGYCLSDDRWHEGIVGLIASNIKERSYRPVIALAPSADGMWKGSARSIPGVNIRDVLAYIDAQNVGLLERYGGHAMAAGLSIKADNLDQLQQVFSNAVSEWYLQVNDMPLEFKQELLTDGSLNEELLSLSTARVIRKAGPWGQRFEEPLFSGKFIVEEARLVGGVHAKLKIRTPQGSKLMDAIAFSYLKNYDELPRGEIEVVYSLDINYWQGVDTLQLMVKHIQQSTED
jgi:single-stranded-DNA-specific exonuclease